MHAAIHAIRVQNPGRVTVLGAAFVVCTGGEDTEAVVLLAVLLALPSAPPAPPAPLPPVGVEVGVAPLPPPPPPPPALSLAPPLAPALAMLAPSLVLDPLAVVCCPSPPAPPTALAMEDGPALVAGPVVGEAPLAPPVAPPLTAPPLAVDDGSTLADPPSAVGDVLAFAAGELRVVEVEAALEVDCTDVTLVADEVVRGVAVDVVSPVRGGAASTALPAPLPAAVTCSWASPPWPSST